MEVKFMAKRPEKITDFKNDVYFKYLLANDQDPQCVYMLKVLIEGVLHIKCEKVKVLNPNINPQNVSDKDMVLDVRVETETGETIDIEMQASKFSTYNRNRFQSYGASIIVSQTKSGDKNYSLLKRGYQIIVINDVDKNNLKLIDTYKSRNEEGRIEKCNLLTRSYVQLPMIDIIVKQKGIENLSELELVLYIFKNGIDNDIMGLPEQRVVKIMKDKMDRFNENEELRLAAYNRELNIMAHEGEKQEAYEKGEAIGFEKGEIIGLEKGKVEEKMNFIQARYGQVEPEWLETLNEKQLDRINDIIFKEENYERFKQKVENGTD